MNPELKRTPVMITKTIATAVSLGGTSKTSHPSQCSRGIGIHRNNSVMTPIPLVIEFECRRKVSVVGATGGGRNDETEEPSACL